MGLKTFYNLNSLKKRVLCAVLVIILLFVSLLGRVFYLQIFKGKKLQKLAVDEWLRGLPLSSKRGEIFDCSGVSLATTVTTYDIYVRPRNVENANDLALNLSSILELDFEKVLKKVKNTSLSETLVKMQVSEEKSKLVSKYAGVYLSQNVARNYPYSSLFTQVLGYCTIDNYGQAGIESYYDKYLKGVPGKSLTQTNAQGKEIGNSLSYYLPSIPGANLYTSLDVQMQSILERELYSAFLEHKAKNVSGIILDAKTGGIKAMSCLPGFDLNSVPRDDVATLQELSKNKTVVDVYEPGSTFKLVTLAGCLNEGLTNENERFYCGGRCVVDGEKIKCWKSAGHGSETLIEAFKNSCNCVFVQLALRLGLEKFYQYLDLFGLGQKTGVDISGESSGIVMNKSDVRTVDLARIGFGHAIAVTQLQMANLYAMITTGMKTTPHLMDKMEMDGTVLYENQNTSTSLKLKSSTTELVNKMLFNNLNSDGKCTFVEGYEIGGKTGTAQKYAENGAIATGKYISSFIGSYPASDPEYILIVCVNEPSNGAYYGGVVAKPVGQRIFKQIFETKAICPNTSETTAPKIEMPSLVGLTVAEACSKLRVLGLCAFFDSDGEYVIEQLPPPKTMLYEGEIVYLIVN